MFQRDPSFKKVGLFCGILAWEPISSAGREERGEDGGDPEATMEDPARHCRAAEPFNLVIAEKTVKTHVSHILGKMGLQDRTQAAIYAIKQGWFS